MAYTQAQLDGLKAAYASGVLSVEYAGRRTQFQSREDMRAIIAEIEAALTPSAAVPLRTVAGFNPNL
jgi:hypothetical protein